MKNLSNLILASIDVDPQKGFSELCPNELPVDDALSIVDELNANATFAHYRVCSRDAHPAIADWNAETPKQMLEPVGSLNVDVKWNPHCVHGTKGWDLLDGLPHPIEGYDFMVSKGLDHDSHPYGACYHDLHNKKSTGLIEFLKFNNVTHVIVGGLATEFCVMTTVIQLQNAGFNVIVNKAAVRGFSGAESALFDMNEMEYVSVLLNSEAINDYLNQYHLV